MKRKIFSSLLLVAFLCASMSMFVSCKDYEDDINANKDDITALQNQLADLQTTLSNELSSVRSEFNTQISDAKTQLQAAIDQKADQATVTALEARVATLEGDLAAKEAALNAKIDAVNEAVTGLDGRLESVEEALATITAMTGDFEELQKTVNDLKGRVEALESLDIATIAREAVAKDLETQQKALEDFKQQIADADYQGQIDKLKDQIEALPTADDLKDLADKLEAYDIENIEKRVSAAEEAISELQNSLSDYATVTSVDELEKALQKQIDDLNNLISGEGGLNDNINTLTVFVEKLLNSISLVPDLYVGGIEAIEFRILNYTPVVPGTSGEASVLGAPVVNVDNGQTTATYRLNPSSVKEENIDAENIDFVAATAEVRAVLDNSPVAFNGIESFKNGLMTVKLKKTTTESLDLGNNKTYIVALKVPRFNKDNTTTDIYSENSRLVQTTFRPRIAKLAWNASDAQHHYADSTSIWKSKVDNNELVTTEVYYNETKNLAELVTGCYLNGADKHTQITSDELKKYGIAFRFAIPSKTYNTAAPNGTDQQKFATVTPEGVISSKLPDGVTNNMACVGKEPIVRIMLCDTVNNNLLDERYMKIKWSQKMLDDVTLDDKADNFVLGCNDVKAEMTWDWLITKVYAKVQAEGLDQATFEKIYPADKIEWNAKNTNEGTVKDILEFKTTTNENGDALAATWVLSPDFIGNVTNEKDQKKVFKKEIIFKSTMPAQYPDLKMEWTITITLPELPAIAGYFDTYWFEKYNTYDVLPVQYGTPAQTEAQVVYRNNLTSAFGYTSEWGKGNNFFIKNMTECGLWDLQFSADQTIAGYTVNGNDLDEAGIDQVNFNGYLLKNGVRNSARLTWTGRDKSWGTSFDTEATPYLFVPRNREDAWNLINPLAQADEKGIPARTHDKKISISVWAKINGYNKVLVKKYDVCLIAPIRVDAVSKGGFEEGLVNGSTVDAGKLVSITDFRGYAVAQTAIGNPTEFEKYAVQLWKYYDVKSIFFDLSKAKYTLAVNGGSVVANNDLSYADAMTAAKLSELTNKAVNLSLSQSGNNITFKNNGGSNVEEMFYVYIPVTVEYAYGKLTEYVKIPVYPRGQVPASVKRR
ncbi:hypothetical protein [Xylanibacter rarus]|uniref:hypothetical protein n=1 Tax=Xylanibacter rarus TaxID=1676614 RepID=UPI003AB94C8B